MTDSRLSGLYKLRVAERIAVLEQKGFLSSSDARGLLQGQQVLSVSGADKMVENVIGVFGLPMAIAPNFVVNDRESMVPLVIEEPSVVAALSNAAALARKTGGFKAAAESTLLAGQIHIVGFDDVALAKQKLLDAHATLLSDTNKQHPRLLQRGGGARDIELRQLQLEDGSPLIVMHLLVDTCDAMGANSVNTMCEYIAPKVAKICGGNVVLRILSNLSDRSLFSASVRYPSSSLATAEMSGEEVRDRIVLANEIALVDPYRAATHNKGIMNGIDSLAIATGNDWRAIEAGAHAYAAYDGSYKALTKWSVDDNGDLLGEIKLPLKVGVVGGTLKSNAAAQLGLDIAGVESATQLAELMAAVGLAQNFAALRALASSGIQKGHMRMHARSVMSAAGAAPERLDALVDLLIASGEVKDWKAAEILAAESERAIDSDMGGSSAAGKVILIGEHAAVYGHAALAIPIPDAVKALASVSTAKTTLHIPDWNLNIEIDGSCSDGAGQAVQLIRRLLGVEDTELSLLVRSRLPRGMGLGSSAAIAVAITRAIAECLSIDLSDDDANDIAFECEKLAHGTPSGIDNSVSCFATPMLFRNCGSLEIEEIRLANALPIVIGFSHQSGSTAEAVAGVQRRRNEQPDDYEAILLQIGGMSRRAADALAEGNYEKLAGLMNTCHGLLNALGVSTPELEHMVAVARESGALGAKLTGAGCGGAIVALCPGKEHEVRAALHQSGYETLVLSGEGS